MAERRVRKMQTLADYLKYMQTDDILAATEKAKEKSRILLEDQGIAVIALIFSDLLVDLVRQGTADLSGAYHPAELVKQA
jgi:hypothetical protein